MLLPKEGDHKRNILIQALKTVSKQPVTIEEAKLIVATLPKSVMERVYIVFAGSQDTRRKLSSPIIWSAPAASDYSQALQDSEAENEQVANEVEKMMEAKYGKEVVEEERKLGAQILQNSGYKGAIKLTQDALLEAEVDS